MKQIEKIRLRNFKRFKDFSIDISPNMNLFIGDNESGKSSILSAIDIIISGSRSKVEAIGLDSLFNQFVIKDFLENSKTYDNLPVIIAEIYFNEQNEPELNGDNNLDERTCDGLRFICEPVEELSSHIVEILSQEEANFPYEYYSISFKTFSGAVYSSYRKFFRHVLLDNTLANNEYATRSYIKTLYQGRVSDADRNKHLNEYRKHKGNFRDDILKELNESIEEYSFSIKNNSKANLETDLTITENDIDIENKGKGRQCFIKTSFALQRSDRELDFVLIEEPENHLSHLNMKKLIGSIDSSERKQLFIATHSNLISARLDLRQAILLNSSSDDAIKLNNLPEETAKFFIKAPDNNILEYILSSKSILVEGDAEYILMDCFFNKEAEGKPEDFGVHIISVGGTSFKRYLDIARQLGIKTAVIRDNDGDYQENCVSRYEDYVSDSISIFYEISNDRKTFEISIYEDNQGICDDLFSEGRRTLTVQQFMLKNKADCAFRLLNEKSSELETPLYIKNAIEWIKE